MTQASLAFPSTEHIAEFIVNYNLSKLDVDSHSRIVKGYLTEDELITACDEYDARMIADAKSEG